MQKIINLTTLTSISSPLDTELRLKSNGNILSLGDNLSG